MVVVLTDAQLDMLAAAPASPTMISRCGTRVGPRAIGTENGPIFTASSTPCRPSHLTQRFVAGLSSRGTVESTKILFVHPAEGTSSL